MSTRVQQALDTGADRLIVPGYSRLGSALRRHWWPADPEPAALAGATALVTGASSGLGRATVAGLAGLGARVHMLVRDRARGEQARSRIAAEAGIAPSRLQVELCDVSDLEAVRDFAGDFGARCSGGLQVLVHNAGVMPARRTETAAGHELAFATHVLGPHLLTARLSEVMGPAADGPARVIWVSSGGMYAQRLDTGDLQYRDGKYRPGTAYARTKRMQVVLAELWARNLRDQGVVVHCMHPGWADTGGIAASMPRFYRLAKPFLRTAEEGADTTIWLAVAPESATRTGLFWHDRAPRPTHYTARTRETPAQRDALWTACTRLTGEDAAATGR